MHDRCAQMEFRSGSLEFGNAIPMIPSNFGSFYERKLAIFYDAGHTNTHMHNASYPAGCVTTECLSPQFCRLFHANIQQTSLLRLSIKVVSGSLRQTDTST